MLRYTILDIVINNNDNISQETNEFIPVIKNIIGDFNLTNNIKS